MELTCKSADIRSGLVAGSWGEEDNVMATAMGEFPAQAGHVSHHTAVIGEVVW